MSATIARPLPLTAVVAEHSLGSLPAIALSSALGLVAVAVAYTLARLGLQGAQLVWFAGLLAVVGPAAVRLVSRAPSRSERVAVVVVVGFALYLIKVLHGPSAFLLFDEFHHWATLQDIEATGHLFTPNNILAASPYYPGLEVVTDLLSRAGLPAWEAGVLVIGVARLLQSLALFLLFERVAGSARVAGIGAFIYMANPSFLFFDAQFSYESLALPLATFAIWLAVRREIGQDGAASSGRTGAASAIGLTVLVLLAICAVTVTHHVTSIAMVTFLVTWAVVSLVMRFFRRPGSADVLGLALVAVVATLAWTLYVASVTVGYLAPALSGAAGQVLDLLAGDEGGRELFRTATGVVAPLWEQVVGYASVAMALALLPFGLVVLWRRHRVQSAALALGLVSLAYPVTLVARLTARGAELSARSAEFVFLGVGFVGALAIVAALERFADRRTPRRGRGARGSEATRSPIAPGVPDPDGGWILTPPLQPPPPTHRARNARGVVWGAVGALLLLAMGGAVLGIPAWARLPGPYLVAADPRSVEPLGIAAAEWSAAQLGAGQTFMSDRTNRVLLATYGRQHPILAAGDRVDIKDAYFAEELRREDVARLARVPVRYAIVDLRLPTSLPYVGVYVERGELEGAGAWTSPMPMAALTKWDNVPGATRIYDSGDIRIFDIRNLTDARR